MIQKLIIITGSPCVGKTAVAESLFESYENSAYFDERLGMVCQSVFNYRPEIT